MKQVLLDRIHGKNDSIIETHDYSVNQRNALFDVRVCPTKDTKKGFQGKTLKAFILCGWLTRIRT